MSIIKYITRLKAMDDLIRRKATGTPEEFARKLGIHRSAVMENLKEMKELGAEISYCHIRKSYFYEKRLTLFIGKDDYQSGFEQIKGGVNVLMV